MTAEARTRTVFGLSLIGAITAAALAWSDRAHVGLSSVECTAETPWAAHLAWWLLACSAGLLAVLAGEAFLRLKNGGRSRLATPVLASVTAAALIFFVLNFAVDTYVGCDDDEIILFGQMLVPLVP